MPVVSLLFFRNGSEVPALDWLLEQSVEAQDRCSAALIALVRQGHEARRPLVENLGNGLYELRAHVGRVQYRFLYFFYGRTAVVLTRGFTKESKIPTFELERAQAMRREFEADPANHHIGV